MSETIDLDELARHLDDAELKAVEARRQWLASAMAHGRAGKQLPPEDDDWEILLMVAGRGFGKSLAQVQWAWWEAWQYPKLIVHAVAPTLNDVRGTIFEGPAGFLSIIPEECLLAGAISKAYNKNRHELRLRNGSLIRGFGAVDEGGRLRGPQCHALICDELREFDRPAGNLRQAINNALFGLRLKYPDGKPSRAVMGTTPKPIPFLKNFEKRQGVRVVRGTTRENLANLSSSVRSQILSLQGTMLGRQEIDAVYIDEETDLSIIKRKWIRLWPVRWDYRTSDGRYVHKPLPAMTYIVTSYDTASSEEEFDAKEMETDPTACIVLGVFNTHEAFTEKERKALKVRSKYAAILLNCWSERLGLPDLLRKARKFNAIKYGPSDQARKTDITLIEDKSSGPGVRQFLREWGLTVYPCKPRVGKATRMHEISPLIEQGMLFVPESPREDAKGTPIGWSDEFLEQVCAFAGEGSVEHDDYPDTLSQAFRYLNGQGLLEATPEVEFLDIEEKLEHEREKAKKLYGDQERARRGNPYG